MKPIRFTEQMISDYVRMGYWDYSIVSDFWDRNAVLYPDKEAIVEEEKRLTWSKAKKEIDRIAIGLLKLGIRRDDRVAVQLYNCSELFTFRLACEKAGIITVTMLPNLRYAEVSAILKQTDAVGIAIPLEFRRFNYFEMIQKLKADIPRLRHIFVVGEKVPEGAISIKEMTRWPAEVNYPPDTLQKTKFKAF
jgi:non-ribosomal peptide synthetase component E (peptide arylation enzyme)